MAAKHPNGRTYHREDLTNWEFGRLIVLSQFKRGRRYYVRCRCECGNEKDIRQDSVTTGDIVSCGCFGRAATSQRTRVHGESAEPLHRLWRVMILRCTNPGTRDYEWYGGRGITVCERWKDFANFKMDMGQRPDGMTLERVDNDKGYEPGNCRWASRKEQGRNRRSNRLLTHHGRTMTMVEWAEELGVKPVTFAGRVRKWGAERAFAASGAS